MNTITQELRRRFADAIASLTGEPPEVVDPALRPTADPRFGDYQCNAAMTLAKRLSAKPREVAQRIVSQVKLDDLAEPPEIAGPGFINVRLRDAALGAALAAIESPPSEPDRDRVGLPKHADLPRVILDYSSPNIAKQMHVGHLRSTIIGDCFARVLEFLGHEVIRQNHVGDWGTQFGMLIRWYADHPLPTRESHADLLEAIENDYRAAQERFQSDEGFAEQARAAVGRLQSGDPEARRVWEAICALSRGQFGEIYRRLNVLLADDDVCGESFYNDRLADVIRDVEPALLSHAPPAEDRAAPRVVYRPDQGADCLFFEDSEGRPLFAGKDGEPVPMIIRKSDGAFLYATTDLAALRYRVHVLGGRRLIYVTDPRQKQHFEMLFIAARATGWAPPGVTLEHVTFGSVLGEDRRPLKTRSGQNVRLRELLDEAEKRALDVIRDRRDASQDDSEPPATPASAGQASDDAELARHIGIAAVKYADLSRDRSTDYVFNWDAMLALHGNTAPYMLYAYARIRSIYRRAADSAELHADAVYSAGTLSITDPAERALALRLARLPDALDVVARELAPHVLCAYLYDLAGDFMRFYEACPVLKAEGATRIARLRLCDLTARTLRLGLGLLGIEVVERM